MKLVWSPLAVERALEAKAYIAADNPRAADKWAAGLVSAVSKLKRHPKLGRLVPEIGLEEYRQLCWRDFIYSFTNLPTYQILGLVHPQKSLSCLHHGL